MGTGRVQRETGSGKKTRDHDTMVIVEGEDENEDGETGKRVAVAGDRVTWRTVGLDRVTGPQEPKERRTPFEVNSRCFSR